MANCLNVGFIGKLFLPSMRPFSQRSSSLSSFPLPPWLICFVRCHLCSPPCDFLSFNLYFFPMSPQGHAPQAFTETNSRGVARCHTCTHRNMRVHTSLNSTSGVKPSERLQWERKTQMPSSHTHDETQNKIWKRRRFDFYDKFANERFSCMMIGLQFTVTVWEKHLEQLVGRQLDRQRHHWYLGEQCLPGVTDWYLLIFRNTHWYHVVTVIFRVETPHY